MSRFQWIRFIALGALFVGAVWLLIDGALDLREDKVEQAAYAQLVPHVDFKGDSEFLHDVDAVRAFVNDHSEHNIDEEFYSYWRDYEAVTQRLLDYALGRSDERIHLECSARTKVMMRMLQTMGHRVRKIDVYSHDENFPAHVFLEVQDPVSGAWHVQDPDYDIFWRIVETGERASVLELLQLDFSAYEPCSDEDTCGWDVISRERIRAEVLKSYLGLAVIIDRVEGTRKLYTHADRFALDEAQPVAGRGVLKYCDFIAKNCRQAIIQFGL